jgi:hypothetical protein
MITLLAKLQRLTEMSPLLPEAVTSLAAALDLRIAQPFIKQMSKKWKRNTFTRSLYCLVLSSFLMACAPSSSRLDGLRVGMTRDEVTKAIGKPKSTTARDGTEVLIYQFTDKPFGDGMIFPGSYYVQLNQGRVVGWNRDEVKDQLDRERAYRMNAAGMAPPQRVNIQHSGHINQDINLNGRVNVYR